MLGLGFEETVQFPGQSIGIAQSSPDHPGSQKHVAFVYQSVYHFSFISPFMLFVIAILVRLFS